MSINLRVRNCQNPITPRECQGLYGSMWQSIVRLIGILSRFGGLVVQGHRPGTTIIRIKKILFAILLRYIFDSSLFFRYL
jgi:hypothetical protein